MIEDLSTIEKLNLEESDFKNLEAFKPTNRLLMFLIVLIFNIIPLSYIYIIIEEKFKPIIILAVCVTPIIFFFIMVNNKIHTFIFERRLKLSLDYLQQLKVAYNAKWKHLTFNPEDPSSIFLTLIAIFFLFFLESLSINLYNVIFTFFFPNPDFWLILVYIVGISLISYSFSTYMILKGIWSWNRSPNYYGVSFYYLKIYLLNLEEPGLFELVSLSFSSFFEFLENHGIPTKFDESRIESLVNTLRFLKPEDESIENKLKVSLIQILFGLKEGKWIKVIKEIESLEIHLKQAQDDLGLNSVTKGYSRVLDETPDVDVDDKLRIPSKYLSLDYSTFIQKFPDLFLIYCLYCEGKRGESQFIEFKRLLNPNKYEKIALTIASLANTDSGILYFGWDEERTTFLDIDVEKTEQSLLQLINNYISPKFEVFLHKKTLSVNKGLIVIIPRSGKLYSVEGKTPVRSGSHIKYLDAEGIIQRNKQLKKFPKGYIQLETLEKQYRNYFESIKDFIRNYFYIKMLFDDLTNFRNILLSLPSKWELDFKNWNLAHSFTSRFRIPLLQWHPQKPPDEISKLISLLSNIIKTLQSPLFNVNENKELILLLKDTSFRDKDKINHRRCLWTYIHQQNPWNFTDWRYFLEEVGSGKIRLYYEEGRQKYDGQPHQETVKIYSSDEQLIKDQIEEEIMIWLIKRYQHSAESLIEKILDLFESILSGLEIEICR